MSEYMFTNVVEKNLTYGQAIDKLIHENKKVTRSIWKGYWVKTYTTFNRDGVQRDDFDSDSIIIMAVLKNDEGFAPATPYLSDQFATDWMVVE
jgi:hypothetical protein